MIWHILNVPIVCLILLLIVLQVHKNLIVGLDPVFLELIMITGVLIIISVLDDHHMVVLNIDITVVIVYIAIILQIRVLIAPHGIPPALTIVVLVILI